MSKPPYLNFLQNDVNDLRAIINVLLPLQASPQDTVNYAEKLGVVEFLDDLLAESARDADLVDRFSRVSVNVLAGCPIAGVIEWRERRGLHAAAVFDVPRSENVFLEGDIKPLVRAEFYAENIPPLRLAIAGAKPQSPKDWESLVKLLLSDDPTRKTDWPHATLKKPSEFLHQLTRDALHAVLGLRNCYADGTTLAQVLDRIGEKRRVGNMFAPADAEKAVESFIELLPKPPAAPVSADALGADAGPVGSPPV